MVRSLGDPLYFFRASLRAFCFLLRFSPRLRRDFFFALRKNSCNFFSCPDRRSGHTPLPTPGHRRNHISSPPQELGRGALPHAWVRQSYTNVGKACQIRNARFRDIGRIQGRADAMFKGKTDRLMHSAAKGNRAGPPSKGLVAEQLFSRDFLPEGLGIRWAGSKGTYDDKRSAHTCQSRCH